MGRHTGTWAESLYMLILGLGIGLTMQVLVIVVQNTVPYAQMGTATSGVTSFRTLGSAFGTAVFDTLYSNELESSLADALAGSPVCRPRRPPIRKHRGPSHRNSSLRSSTHTRRPSITSSVRWCRSRWSDSWSPGFLKRCRCAIAHERTPAIWGMVSRFRIRPTGYCSNRHWRTSPPHCSRPGHRRCCLPAGRVVCYPRISRPPEGDPRRPVVIFSCSSRPRIRGPVRPLDAADSRNPVLGPVNTGRDVLA